MNCSKIAMESLMKYSICASYILVIGLCATSFENIENDGFKTVPQLIEKYGYPVETHSIETEDGYFVTVFRIPRTANSDTPERPPILLVHGLLGSSADYILLGPGDAIAYLLADEGYDVWLLNCRGTRYSETHRTLKPTDSKFWDFSWHEIGIYDVPSTIDYILDTTGHEKLIHMGTSQGSTSLFVMLAEKPEYNNKLIAHISYAPVAFLCYPTHPIRYISWPERLLGYTAYLSEHGHFNMSPYIPGLPILGELLCKCGKKVCPVCKNIAYMLLDIRQTQFNSSSFSTYLGHFPGGASAKLFVHYAQSIQTCEFRHYKKSMSEVPKSYDLNNIQVPIYAFYGTKDSIQNLNDTLNFGSKLPNKFKETHQVEGYGHSDFIIADGVRHKVYEKMVTILRRLH